MKAGVALSGRAEDGYNAADENGNTKQSEEIFKGKDKDGNDARFRLHISAAPGQDAIFVVKQMIIN